MRHTMRLPLAALLTLPLVACVQQVGGDGDDDHPHTGSCEEVHDAVVIAEDADWDQVPSGCWDLYNTLSLSGAAVTSLEKLGDLKGINDLQIKNTKLTTLDSPKTLHVYGQLEVTGNALLANLENLEMEEHATTTTGDIDTTVPVQITLDNNALLTTAPGLAGVTVIDGNLTVTNNPKLTKLSFTSLTKVDGTIKIVNNAALTSVEMPSLADAHRIEVRDNGALTMVGSIAATTVNGDIVIRNNAKLTSINPMGSLEQLAGTLYIEDNAALTSLNMFTSSMQDMVGISIRNNTVLANLGLLSHIHGINSITINSNPKLSQCLALEVSTCVPVHGTPAISNNMTASNCHYWCQN